MTQRSRSPKPGDRFRRFALAAAMLSASLGLSGCYGRFPLTRAFYKINGDVHENKFVKSGVFWVFAIFQIYSFAGLGDAIIFNLIEFWTGEAVEIGSADAPDGSKITLAPSADGREATLTRTRDGAVLSQDRLIRREDGKIEVRSASGELTAFVEPAANGGFRLTSPEGRELASLPADAARR